MPKTIHVLAFANVQLLDVTGPLQVFASANDIARQKGLPPPYAPTVIASGGGGATASAIAIGLFVWLTFPRFENGVIISARPPVDTIVQAPSSSSMRSHRPSPCAAKP